jgi:small conductance mechanosensitive channel
VQADFSQAWKSLNDMSQGFVERLPYIVAAVIVFFLFVLLAHGSAHLIHRFAQNRRKHRNLGFVLSRLTQGTIVLLGLMVAMVIAIPSFQPGQLVQVLGLSTVAIGFAFRDVLQNFLAGIVILLTEPFRIGDQIRIEGYYGIVEDIHTRATSIRTFDRRRIVIPNSEFFTKAVEVTTAFKKRRIEHVVGIGYGDDIENAKRIILNALHGLEGVLDDPAPDTKVSDLAASSVNLTVRWWINPSERTEETDSRDQVLTAVKRELLAHGVDLPYETHTVLFHDQSDETDGDRTRQREGWPAGDASPKPRSIASALLRSGEAQTGNGHSPGSDRENFLQPSKDGERN